VADFVIDRSCHEKRSNVVVDSENLDDTGRT
jgi:hypothetical protein